MLEELKWQKNYFKYLVHTFDGTMTDTDRLDPKIPISKWRANSCGEAIWAQVTEILEH